MILVFPVFLFFYFFSAIFTVRFFPAFHFISSHVELSASYSFFILNFLVSTHGDSKYSFYPKWKIIEKSLLFSSCLCSIFINDFKASSSFFLISLAISSQFCITLPQYPSNFYPFSSATLFSSSLKNFIFSTSSFLISFSPVTIPLISPYNGYAFASIAFVNFWISSSNYLSNYFFFTRFSLIKCNLTRSFAVDAYFIFFFISSSNFYSSFSVISTLSILYLQFYCFILFAFDLLILFFIFTKFAFLLKNHLIISKIIKFH